MKKLILFIIVFLLAVTMTEAAGQRKKLNQIDKNMSILSATFTQTDSRIDTLLYNFEPNVSRLDLALAYTDSVSVTEVCYERYVNNIAEPRVAGDSIAAFSYKTNVATPKYVKTGNISLSTPFDYMYIIINYASSNNGVTSPACVAKLYKQLNYKN